MRLSKTASKTYSLLSIGQRGVGKTVFLAGSYAELHPDTHRDNPQQMWFDCQNREVQANLEKIFSYVARNGLYPPATIKITDFNFSLKHQTLWGIQTLCNFRWWDIPGEICNLSNPEFQRLVLVSQGCCVFINAQSLVHDSAYLQIFKDIADQVIAIASLASQHQLRYAFALILTKCDLLEPGPASLLQLEKNLQPLLMRLDATKATYQKFYSAIPIVSVEGMTTFNARGAAAPLLWLLSQLNKHQSVVAQQTFASGLSQSLFMGQLLPVQVRRYILALSLASLGFLGVIATLGLALGLFPSNSEQTPAAESRPSSNQRVTP